MNKDLTTENVELKGIEPPQVLTPSPQAKIDISKEQNTTIDFKKWIDSGSSYVPLAQTMIWIILLIWIIRKFDDELKSIVESVRKRIEQGGGLTAGPFKLDELKPESTASQAERIKEEVVESSSSSSESSSSSSSSSSNRSHSSDSGSSDVFAESFYHERQLQSLAAEDLVLRKLQSDYDALINRQVSSGAGSRFDGFFVKENHAYGIEVKHVRKALPWKSYVGQIQKIHDKISLLGWKRFTLVFSIVLDNDSHHLSQKIELLRAELNKLNGDTILRVFKIRDLADEFGIKQSNKSQHTNR